MNIHKLEYSIIVTANDYNPTILNPDFLSINNIIPAEWEWKVVGSPITTPPFATVQFENRVSLSVDVNKFQIKDRSENVDLQQNKIKEIAQKFIEVLPHVRYSAVGINFVSMIEQTQPDTFLKDHFIKKGNWDNESNNLEGVSLTLSYPLKGGKLVLAIDSGSGIFKLKDQREKVDGILASANFHRDCSGYPANEQVIEYIGNLEKDIKYYNKIIGEILKK